MQVLIVDSRSFLEYNDMHIVGAVNVCCSKLVKRRLQQDKVLPSLFVFRSFSLFGGLRKAVRRISMRLSGAPVHLRGAQTIEP